MDLELSDDQFALRDGIRAMLVGRFESDRIRRGFDRSVYDELAAAGVFSLIDDGFSWCDAAVVFEQLGEFCVPGPLVACALAGGSTVAGVVTPSEPFIIEHLGALDVVIVLARDAVFEVPAASLVGTPSPWPLDPLTPVTRVDALPAGTRVGDADRSRLLAARGATLTAAFALGMSARLTEMSVAYAKEREQFDRPIGSFQAIKHLLADMAVRTEVARAAVYAAAAHLDAPELDNGARAASVAKALAGEAAILNGKAATQVHGGMGYTWEVDVHLYLKRAWVLDTHFGSIDHHCDAVFQLL